MACRSTRRYWVLGDQVASLNGSTAVADWDGTVLVVSQGATQDYGYFSYEPGDGGTSIGTIPFGYAAVQLAPRCRRLLLMIVYDASGNGTQETFYLSTAAGYGQLTPAAGSKLYPVYAELKSGALVWGATATAFDATQNLELDSASRCRRAPSEPLGVRHFVRRRTTRVHSADVDVERRPVGQALHGSRTAPRDVQPPSARKTCSNRRDADR